MNRILIVEDEEIILKALTRLLERNHFEVSTAMTVEEAIEAQPQSFDLILADLRLPGAEGTEIIPIADPIPVVIMTSHASVRSAVTAMRNGAIDYIAKPFDHDELLIIIRRSLMQNRMRAQNQSLKQDLRRLVPAENVMHCHSMQPILDRLRQLNDDQLFLALNGEYGTGKELLARIAHANSDRAEAPFVVADLPSLEPSRIQASLLGGEMPKPDEDIMPGGLLHSAHNGSLVLRHPSSMPHDVQKALALALSERGMAGASGMRSINVRTVLISEHGVEDQQASGELHESLAALFASEDITIPALRHMQEDVLVLAEHFLGYFGRHHHRQNLSFTESARAALLAYQWPGNTDELKSLVERAVLLTTDTQITPMDLGLSTIGDTTHTQDLSLDEYFRYFVTRHQSALSETDLAARLGISRKALWERRQKMQLQRE